MPKRLGSLLLEPLGVRRVDLVGRAKRVVALTGPDGVHPDAFVERHAQRVELLRATREPRRDTRVREGVAWRHARNDRPQAVAPNASVKGPYGVRDGLPECRH